MRRFAQFKWMSMLLVFLIGCGPSVRQWDMREAQDEVNELERDEGPLVTVKAPAVLQESIAVTLVVPKHMGCVTLAASGEDKAAGHKMGACPLKPIAGNNPKNEVKAIWDAEPAKKSNLKLALAVLEIGPVMKSELENALKKYYKNVVVNVVSESSDPNAIKAQNIVVYPIWGGKETEVKMGNDGVSGNGTKQLHLSGGHLAWYIPTMLITFPLFMWAPMMGMQNLHDAVGANTVVASIRISMAQLAEEIAKQGGMAVGSTPHVESQTTAGPAPAANGPKIWSLVQNGATTGPFSSAEVQQMKSDGTITSSTLVWKEGMADWQPLSSVSELN